MDIKKCDRCGREIELGSAEGDMWSKKVFLTVSGCEGAVDVAKDLCPECFDALTKYIFGIVAAFMNRPQEKQP